MGATFDFDFTIEENSIELLDVESSEVELEFDSLQQVTTSDHNKLQNRSLPDQHPIEAITNLNRELQTKVSSGAALTNIEIQKIIGG